LPKGGGAIRGIGEKFAANPVTGTGSMTVPIATSAGRSGFGPQLSLAYDSGAGNGPFGLGWSLSLPSITRKTDKGLPTYQDADESDVFILSSAEDLVPVLTQNTQGHWVREPLPTRTINGVHYRIQRYRPRIEGLFARIERWTNTADPTDVFWRSITKDNVTTWYGKTDESRLADPADLQRIFSWLICESYDDKGNAIVYGYVPEDDKNVRAQANERNRIRTASRYLKRIKYGNHVSRLLQPDLAAAQWMFEVVFDYGEHHPANPKPHDSAAWPVRNDPFSSYRSGFEVRTYRLCRRVLMFHHFSGELNVGADCLVRSTDFHYAHDIHPADAHNPIFSLLLSVTHTGYTRQNANSYHTKSLPPVAFTYSEAIIQSDLRELESSSLDNVPMGIDGSHYQWVDLDGEGLSSILTEQADAWFYKRNLSPLNVVRTNGTAHVEAQFGPLERVATRPTLALADRAQFLDLAGDGRPDVVQFDGPTPGFYERTLDEQWDPFVAFRSLPVVDWKDPNLKFIDLNGDGHADILMNEDNAFTWYGSLGEAGFAPGQRVTQPWDEEHGPRVVFADGTQAMYLADMSGDGLTDIVRIRNGEVCYWPNLGYGRFGAKVTMDNAPRFDRPDQFDQHRIRLADIDGSGVTDILYLHADSVSVYFNQSGNSWSIPTVITQLPALDNLTGGQVLDLLGNGTACLVWSSPLLGNARRPLRYLDLIGGQKPHLLVKTVNNLGAETHVHYVPSTKFYLQDRRDGTPWITKLPFPVHVVERVETYDHISGSRFVTRYAYHHGYFDGVEREFRGFGRVDQWDTEEFAALNANQQVPVGTNVEASSHVPPVLTRTWFHTGIYLGRERVSNVFAGLLDANDKGEYYREPGLSNVQAKQLLLDDTVLPAGWTVEEEREACRALKGAMLRQEIYALDGTDKEKQPYTVTEQTFTIERLQPQASNRHAVFFTHAREALSYHYERHPADPRINHALTMEVDAFGNVLKSATIGYGRRKHIIVVDAQGHITEIPNPDLHQLDTGDQEKQTAIFMTYTGNRFTDSVNEENDYRTPLLCEARTYELTGYSPSGAAGRFQISDLVQPHPSPGGHGLIHIFDREINYEEKPGNGKQRRLIELVRTYFRNNALTGPLPLGGLQSLALPFDSFKLALTPGLLAEVYGGRVTDAMLASEGGYVHSEGDANWWIPSGQMFYVPDPAATSQQERDYARAHFFLPQRYRDPFHTPLVSTETFVMYDSYDLLVQETRDPLGNRATVGERSVDPTQPLVRHGQDYRVLQPALIMDPNRNRSAVTFDALGMVVGMAVMGKPEDSPVPGDRLEATFRADLTQVETDQFFTLPTGPIAATLLDQATTRIIYDLERFRRTREAHPDDPTQWLPPCAATLARETHVSELQASQQTRIQISFSYSDGFGREIQKKLRAEPGPVPRRDPVTGRILTINGQPEMTPNDISPRWVGSGWTVFNNKGKPVRQYEPFFTDTHRFEFDVRIGVSPVLFYDPVERVVATLHPNHTWEKVVFDPWHQATWDVSDTVLVADPKTDSDVDDFFSRPPDAEYIPPWHTQRQGGTLGPQEQVAARKAAIHARTPTIAHFDSLGRTFLTVAHNKFKYSNTPAADPPAEEFHRTRTVFDIEGNQRQVIDALDRVVMRYDYDMLGTRIHQASMEAGKRWMLNDVAGKPIRTWDSREHQFHIAYDPLRRPTASYLHQGAGDALLVERTVYGETRLNPEDRNLRGKVVQHFDQAGIITSDDYDFKGNLLRGQRQLAQKYNTTLDWTTAELLEAPIYISRTRYDALNRPIQLTAPHSDQHGTNINIIQPGYNEANLLEQVHAWLNQNTEPSGLLDSATANLHAVTDIDYDAKGQRTLIDYGNGVRTTYTYDPLTFRLVHLLTQPPPPGWPGSQVQNLHYTYDPAGNITHIRDDAQQTIYFRNQRVEPSTDYTYDALYRLIEATGREHIGQAGRPWTTFDDAGRVNLPHPHDGQAMRTYTEQYLYDAVGNFDKLIHQAVNGNWIRAYEYHEASVIEPAKPSNRLSRTVIHPNGLQPIPEPYTHDPHGNMIRMPHFVNHPNPNQPNMHWDFKDQLQSVDLDGSADIEQVLREKKSFTLRCILDRRKELQGRVGPWNRFASSVSLTSACSLL
jgi:hypothetical protein